MSSKYKESGVSLEAGYESVERIKKHIKKTNNLGVMGNIGDFGGLFDLSKYNIKKPVLVSGTDGVGTKLLLAQEMGIHNTIGIDLVAMCVNDVLAVGASPLFFLDYIAVGKNDPTIIEEIVSGISQGCVESNCALIGGETAEMPDMYQDGHYDLAGYTTGVVDKDKMLNKENVLEGQTVIGLASSGLHSNGYSLVRKVFFKDNQYCLTDYVESLKKPLYEELLRPTKIYVAGVVELLKEVEVSSISHITGGGFIENIPRSLPNGLAVEINESSLPQLAIFNLIEELGNIQHEEMYNVFNMGIGMTLIVKNSDVNKSLEILNQFNYDARVIGTVVKGRGVSFK